MKEKEITHYSRERIVEVDGKRIDYESSMNQANLLIDMMSRGELKLLQPEKITSGQIQSIIIRNECDKWRSLYERNKTN